MNRDITHRLKTKADGTSPCILETKAAYKGLGGSKNRWKIHVYACKRDDMHDLGIKTTWL